ERYKSSIFLAAGLEMVGHKIANGGTCPFKLRLSGEIDHKKIYGFFLGCVICTEAFVTLNLALKGIFDVLVIPGRGLGLVDVIKQVPREINEASLVKLLRKGSLDEIAGLFSIHFASTR